MAESKRKPGRPSKHMGLVTPDTLKKVVHGSELRDLQASDEKPEGSVLPHPRKADPPSPGSLRVFGTADRDDRGRPAEVVQAPVPDTSGRIDAAVELRLSDILKQVGLEMTDPAFSRDYGRTMTNLEALARRLWTEALGSTMGSQRARDQLVERLEGKAVRGEKPATPDTTLNEQLDRTEAELINSLTAKEDNVP